MTPALRRALGAIAAIVGVVGLVPAAAGAATITPTNTADAGAGCTLREAVQSANTNTASGGCTTGDAGTDTIALGAASYNLTMATPVDTSEDANVNGDLDLSSGGPVRITGAGLTATTINAAGIGGDGDRALHLVNVASDVVLADLTVSGGDVTAFAVGSSDARGGDVSMLGGTLTLNRVRVTGGDAALGGGIYVQNDGVLNLNDSVIDLNDATDADSPAGLGGGIATANDSQTTIARSTLSNNSAVSSLANDNSGGAIYHSGGTMTITDSELDGNFAQSTGNGSGTGGAIHTSAELTVRRSLIAGNATISTTGDDEFGGGIYSEADGTEPVNVTNTTIYENSSGGLFEDGDGGGIYNDGSGTFGVSHVTFALNVGVLGDHVRADGGPITLGASIIPGLSGFVDLCSGTNISSIGYNVANFNDGGCGFVGTDSIGGGTGTVGGAPVDNGGFTGTIGLQLGGRAADLVPAASCGPAEGQDQRGYPRPLPIGGACDAGAYELHSCDGASVLNGPFVACPVPPTTQPPAPAPSSPAKKCKKKKKKKGKKARAAAKCKKKKKRR